MKIQKAFVISGIKQECDDETVDIFTESDEIERENEQIIYTMCYVLIVVFLCTSICGIFIPHALQYLGVSFNTELFGNFFFAMLLGELVGVTLCITIFALFMSCWNYFYESRKVEKEKIM